MDSGQLAAGTVLNRRYQIQSVIGRGGMGTVYLAKHRRLDTVVAVKEVFGEYATRGEQTRALRQLESEARFLVRLNHPNLPRVNDAFVEKNRCYLVMEYIHGVTMENVLAQHGGGPLDIRTAIEWGVQIADVLAYLHRQEPPVIFRDLKPANVMLDQNGLVRLIDFGIARRFRPGADKDTAQFGSVGYSPIEQYGSQQTDARADIYSLGATLHQFVTGRDPAGNPFEFLPAHLLNQKVPPQLSLLLKNCLEKSVWERPQQVAEVRDRLQEIYATLSACPVPEEPQQAVVYVSEPVATGALIAGRLSSYPIGNTTQLGTQALAAGAIASAPRLEWLDYRLEPATRSDISTIVGLNRAVFRPSDLVMEDVLQDWWQRDPKVFTCLRWQSEPVAGYYSLLFLQQDLLESLKRDETQAKLWRGKDLCSGYEIGEQPSALLFAVVMQTAHASLSGLLVQHLKQEWRTLFTQGCLREVLAIGTTKETGALLERKLGFRCLVEKGTRRDGHPLYALTLTEDYFA